MTTSGETRLRLQLIGPLQVFLGESLAPVSVPRGRATTLLALLAAHRDQVVALETIVASLWPPAGTPNGAQIVASLVSRLRRVLGPQLEHVDTGYRLNCRGWEVDLDIAERLVRAAEHHLHQGAPGLAYSAAQRALQLLATGRPLEDQRSLAVVDDLATITDVLMQRARRIAWTSALTLGDATGARLAAAAAVAASPLDEEAQRALMQSQYELGESNAALATYARLRSQLRMELGTDPEPQTQSLHLRILRGEPSDHDNVRTARRPVRRIPDTERQMSPADAQFVGRDALLADLRRTWHAVASGDAKALAIIGGPDSGKTELLRALTDHVADTGGAVLTARCTSYARGIPLQPIADAIRRFCATEHHDFVREVARGSEAALVDLVPAMADVLGAHAPLIGVSSLRDRLEAFQTLMLNLSMHHPVLLGIDDAHLADDQTIAALHRLCDFGAGRVLVGVTVHDLDAHEVENALGVGSRKLILNPLTKEDVGELARRWRVPHAVEEVHALTGGVPGLVNRALRAIAEGADLAQLGEPLPALLETVQHHLRAAGESVVRTLALAAVLGRRFRFEDLVNVGFSLVEATTATQRALGMGLLVHDGDQLDFASDLVHAAALRTIPDAIRCDIERCLPAPDRREEHRQLVDPHRGPRSWVLEDLDPAS